MRYQNWDVLLFPECSKIPLQEFKTACHVAKDSGTTYLNPLKSIADLLQESPFLSNSAFANNAYHTGGGSLSLTPVLTSFIASLQHGDKFRVSVHSWERPKASSALEGYMTSDDVVMFEARVYIDGLLVATHVVDHRTQWPVVIDTNRRFEQDGMTESLRFPPFHPSILKQEHWEPNESFGRIKVVVGEGLTLPYNPVLPCRVGFDRFRDVITFSFQHATIDVLQFSGISWPNPGMWKQPLRSGQRPPPIGTKADYDAHAHSPRRAVNSLRSIASLCYNDPIECAARNCAHPIHYSSLPSGTPPLYQANWRPQVSAPGYVTRNPMSAYEDPFMGPPPPPVHSKRWSCSHDVPMPDYVSSKSEHSRAYTEMSGVSYEPKDFVRSLNEAAVEEILEALSPVKKDELVKVLSPGMTAAGAALELSEDTKPSHSPVRLQPSPGIARKISNQINPSIDEGRNASASTRPEHPLSNFSTTHYSNSPADSIQSKKETIFVLADEDIGTPAPFGSACTKPNLASNGTVPTRDTLVESNDTHRRRSTSNASKRKRSQSMKKDSIGRASPATTGKSKGLTLLDSAYSPLKSDGASPQSGGVALGA